MSSLSSDRFLHQLARLYGVQMAYYDMNHHRQQASEESLLAVLRSLGAPVASLQDVLSAWRERQQALWQQMIEPVVVAWNGEPLPVEIHLPLSVAETNLNCYLNLESGEHLRWDWHGADFQVLQTVSVEGKPYVVKQFPLPNRLPWGYHHLTLELLGRQEESAVISCPLKTYTPPAELEDRSFGVFLPLYALHSKKIWGSGDFSDLQTLIAWVAGFGGRVVATLPLLATFLDKLSDPSPYLPASRLLWNEFYLDINAVPELQECPSAQALLESSSFQNEIKALRNSPLVDYQRQMALKREVLNELCRCLFAEASNRLEELHRFAEANPLVEDYARFRAARERHRNSWRFWPHPLREGVLTEGDYDEENKRYHLYVQWLAHQQIESVFKEARGKGVQLYLDLPLGVHPDGYDVWRGRETFVPDISAGAPPDPGFAKGQNWAFPPLHPERIREQGYRYVIACLRHHLQCAGILRIDHVMSLHRLFCIPNGMEASQGVYVRYRAEELYAILALESHRHKAIIVGEDLGTVPSYVRPAMRRHDLHRMYVVHYELASELRRSLPPVSSNSVASLNTHDMPPFAAFWQGLDIKERRRIGLLDRAGVKEEKNKLLSMKKALITFLHDKNWLQGQENDIVAVLKACLSFLADSRARMVLINLEDLWLETQPQNVPSTRKEYPNWRRKAQYAFEHFCQLPQVVDTLLIVNELRKRSKHRR
ncbi:MAG: 4-alpha-glucanotransferase [Dehalococcoidales bacterium]